MTVTRRAGGQVAITHKRPFVSQDVVRIPFWRLVVIVSVLVPSVLTSGCSNNSNPLDQEADQALATFEADRFRQCGEYKAIIRDPSRSENEDDNSYRERLSRSTFPPSIEILAIRDLSFVLQKDQVSAADKLNGIQWKGTAVPICTAYRERGEWLDCKPGFPPMLRQIRVVKKDNTWKVASRQLMPAGACL